VGWRQAMRWRLGWPGRGTLRLGSRGDDVRRVQERLRELGYDPGPADGVYGWLTLGAVRDFQRAVGLEQDGVVGRRVRGVLFDEALSGAGRWTLAAELSPGGAGTLALRALARQAPIAAAVAVPVPVGADDLGDAGERASAAAERVRAAGAAASILITLHNRWNDVAGEHPRGALQLLLHSRRGLEALERAVRQAAEAAEGVHLDLGPLRWGDGARFLSFLRRTAGALAEAHKSLTVALPLREARGWTRLASDLDYGAVARLASWVVLTPPARMPRTVPPRPPTAAELAAALRWTVRSVPPWRCLLAVPVGALALPVSAETPPSAMPHYHARALAYKARQRPQWHEAAGRLGFPHRAEGQDAWIWLETEAGLAAKLALVRRFRLGGLYLVGCGQEDPRLWRALRREHVSPGGGIWINGKRSRRDAEEGSR